MATTNTVISIDGLDTAKIELLKRTICKGATNDELELFIHACRRTGLDPFMKQIYAVKRFSEGKESMTVQTGIDGYRLIAERSGKYMPGRECTFMYDKENRLLSATAYVKKLDSTGQWHEVAHTVYWNEYAAKRKDGSFVAMWGSKPHIMLSKCAESAALRKAFPADLSGVYTHEEMEQASSPLVIEEEKADPVDEVKQSDNSTGLNPGQVKSIKELIGDDSELLHRILDGYAVKSLENIEMTHFNLIIKNLQARKAK